MESNVKSVINTDPDGLCPRCNDMWVIHDCPHHLQRIAEKVRAMKKSVGLLRLESVEKTDRDYYAQKRDYETYNQALDDVLKILEEEYAVGK